MVLPAYYEFCCRVQIVAGHQALEEIPALLKSLNAATPIIITDKGVTGAGLIPVVQAAMEGCAKAAVVEDDVPADSDLLTVTRIAERYREHHCDAIIAVGGGSVLDTAKGVNILVSEGSNDLIGFAGAGALKRHLKPLIAVPTTSGTGSEVTLVAVIADHEKQMKMLFTSHFLLPDAAVLDSRMTMTLPVAVTAATGMDAMTHAIEAYTCLAKNPLSDSHALRAIELISRNLLNVVKNPDDKDGRLALAIGANLAGIAFSNSMVGMVHTLGHSVGAVCGAPHGACMAVLLPYGLEYNRHKNGAFTAELLFPLAGASIYAKTPSHAHTDRVISFLRQLNDDLHEATEGRHPRSLNEMKDSRGTPLVSKETLPAIARKALGDGSIFYNPEELDYEDLLMVLNHAWEGTPLRGSHTPLPKAQRG